MIGVALKVGCKVMGDLLIHLSNLLVCYIFQFDQHFNHQRYLNQSETAWT